MRSAPPSLQSQAASVPPDARVRLIAIGAERWVIGTLLAPPGDTVKLLEADSREIHAVATAGLTRFEVSRGRRRQTARGAWIGLATGGIAGAVLGAATYEDCDACLGPDPGEAGSAILGSVLGGLFGLGIGALVGSAFTGERWSPVPQPWGS